MSLEIEKKEKKEKEETSFSKSEKDSSDQKNERLHRISFSEIITSLSISITNFFKENTKLIYYSLTSLVVILLLSFIGVLIIGFQNEADKKKFGDLSTELEEVKFLENTEEKKTRLLTIEKIAWDSCFNYFSLKASKNFCLLGALVASERENYSKKTLFLKEYVDFYEEEDLAFLVSFFLAQEYENQNSLKHAIEIYKSLGEKVKTPLVNTFFSFQEARVLYLQKKFAESYQMFLNLQNQGEKNPFIKQINSYLLLLSLGQAQDPETYSFHLLDAPSETNTENDDDLSSDSDLFVK